MASVWAAWVLIVSVPHPTQHLELGRVMSEKKFFKGLWEICSPGPLGVRGEGQHSGTSHEQLMEPLMWWALQAPDVLL